MVGEPRERMRWALPVPGSRFHLGVWLAAARPFEAHRGAFDVFHFCVSCNYALLMNDDLNAMS